MKIIPDKLINVTMDSKNVVRNLIERAGGDFEDETANAKACQIIDDFNTKFAGVKETFKQFIYEYDCAGKTSNDIC